MAKSLLICGGDVTTTTNTTQYTYIVGTLDLATTELPKRIPFRDAGTISKLGIRVISNSTTANTTVRLRKNGSNGNQVITIAGGQTGEFIDNTNTDTITAGDTLSIQIVTPNGGTIQIIIISAIYEPTTSSITTTRLAVTRPISHNASVVFYAPLHGDLDIDDTTTTDHRIIPRIAGDFKHWALYSSAGGRAVACRLLKNNVDDVLNKVLLAENVTGLGENTTDSISSDTDDDFTNLFVFGGSGSTRTLDFIALSFVNTGSYSLLISSQSDSYNRGPGTDYHKIAGYIQASATENNTKMKCKDSFVLSKMAIRIESNTLNGSATIRLRKNGANGNQVITVNSGQTGTFVDSSNTDTVNANDDINYEFIIGGSSGLIGLTWTSMLAENVASEINATSDHKDILKQRPQQLITNSI